MSTTTPAKPEFGTVSHGTMRECDLIPAFMSVLRDYSPAHADRITDEYGANFIERCGADAIEDGHEDERQAHLLEDLFDALDEIARVLPRLHAEVLA